MEAEDQEIVQEFLIESNQNLSRVEQDILALEQRPGDPQILSSIFRSFHTVKGTCGFLGFEKLESITHQAENLLTELREGRQNFSPQMASLILETLDIVMQELSSIESTGAESDIERTSIILRLEAALTTAEPEDVLAPGKPAPAVPAAAIAAKPEHIEAPAAISAAEPAVAEAAAPAEPAAAAESAGISDPTIRIDIRLVDRLINLVGELVLVRNQMLQAPAGDASHDKTTAHRLNQITTELQESVMRSRMQPVGTIWNKLPRLVRDTASQLKKEIRLESGGANTEMDRTILEAVKDPLTHILRNSCDHGLETPEVRTAAGKTAQGTVQLKAYHEGSQVVIEIEDDGRGIDPEKLRAKAVEKGVITPTVAATMSDREAIHLIFHAGFSTAEKVTNISGRGVGMDVVRKNIQSIGGQVEIDSRVGEGTKVRIRIPLTLAIIPGLVVTSGGHTFVIPQANLVELIRLQGERLSAMDTRQEGRMLRWRGGLIPVIDVNESLRLSNRERTDVINVAILEAEGETIGLILDRICATREIVVKPLGRQLKSMRWYAGATILGDGTVALILDVAGLARRENLSGHTVQKQMEAVDSAVERRQQFLIVSAGSYKRVAAPLGQVDRLEKLPAERVERVADCRAVQYRGELLRLVSLARVLGSGGDECLDAPSVNVIVIREGEKAIGLAVDAIVDVQDSVVEAPTPTAAEGLLATFVLNGHATELLDIPRVLAAADPVWNRSSRFRKPSGAPVLVGADSRFDATSLASYLELGGTPVEAFSKPCDLLKRIEKGGYRSVVIAWRGAGLETDWESLRARVKTAVYYAGDGGAAPEWVSGLAPFDDAEQLRRLICEGAR